ncbi:MAG: ATP-binding protein [Opitutaceae bacterium]|nr:ATP-binding protein [Opitutaceae bacterium]
MRKETSPTFCGWGRGRVLALASLGMLCLQGTIGGQTVGDGERSITDPGYYYQRRDQFGAPQQVDFTFRVLYYDPAWRVLWGDHEDAAFFLKTSALPLALLPGDEIRVRGTLDNVNGLQAGPDGVTKLGTPGLPEPIPATNRLHEASALANRLVRVEAYIDKQEMVDDFRAKLFAVVHGRRIIIRVNNLSGEIDNFTGSFVTAEGIYAYTPSIASGPATIEIWCPSPDRVKPKESLRNDVRFEVGVTPIEKLREVSPTQIVRIVGAVHRQDPGISLTVRDGTGQAVVLTAQTESLTVGAIVEAIGYAQVQGANLSLASAQYRLLPADGMPGGAIHEENVHRFVDQVLSLTPEEIAGDQRAMLTGVVTWIQPDADSLYLQDSTGGILVRTKEIDTAGIGFGAILRVEGKVTQGLNQQEISAVKAQRGADEAFSAPRAITLDQAMAGVAQSQWVELTGYLREIKEGERDLTMHLTTPSGEFTAAVPPFARAEEFLNSVIHVRGVCTSIAHGAGDNARVHLLVQSPDDISIEAALPQDLTALPLQALGHLNARGIRTDLNRWVRTSGILTLHEAATYLYLQDGAHSLRVLTRENRALMLGDRVEVVGLLGREEGKQVLREAKILTSRPNKGAGIDAIQASAEPTRALDGRVVRVTGTILDTLDRRDQRRVVLQFGEKLVEARFANPAKQYLPEGCVPGAEAELRGIYHVELNDYQQPRNFTLLLRNSADITIIKGAPWWTLERALSAAMLLGLGILFVVGWVAFLRRRVRAQTMEILAQRDKEAKLEAELERSSRLESLGLLAGGIAHDFNNMLTVVVGNITLASMETPSNSHASELLEEAEKGALRARELTQQLLTFARGGDPVRTAVPMAALVRDAAEFALSGSKIGTEFDTSGNLPPAFADRAQLSQVVHNLVLHSAHSMPQGGRIIFSLRDTRIFDGDLPGLVGGTYLKLSISDTGSGIAPEHLGRIFDPYFQAGPNKNGLGLATVRSIVKRHNGHISVSSRVNEGTTFTIWLPTTKEAAAEEKPKVIVDETKKALRILFMDDDDAIRRFAHTLLTRLGHEATTVANGTEAVHAYAAAFEINKPFDVVVLDLTIAGGMGGQEALEHLQNIDPQVRAIVSSGYSSDPILSDYHQHGFSGIVSKPYKIADLAQALQDVMAKPPASPAA